MGLQYCASSTVADSLLGRCGAGLAFTLAGRSMSPPGSAAPAGRGTAAAGVAIATATGVDAWAYEYCDERQFPVIASGNWLTESA